VLNLIGYEVTLEDAARMPTHRCIDGFMGSQDDCVAHGVPVVKMRLPLEVEDALVSIADMCDGYINSKIQELLSD
jgi:hypothetical protein